MPNMFAQKHNLYLEQYYKTARKVIFNKERSLFAAHKTGYCFQAHIYIKQFPALSDGIQYVGMIRPQITDNDYILTDMNGFIDSFTSGVGLLFNLNPSVFKDSSQVNIQYLAPELIQFFGNKNEMTTDFDRSVGSENSLILYKPGLTRGRTLGQQRQLENSRFSNPGGDILTFYIPTNFLQLIKFNDHSVKANRAKQSQRFENMTSNSPNTTINTNANQNATPNSGKQSAVFREFIKHV
jgi:hypothetical protein